MQTTSHNTFYLLRYWILDYCKNFYFFSTISALWPSGFQTKLARQESGELWNAVRASGICCRIPLSITSINTRSMMQECQTPQCESRMLCLGISTEFWLNESFEFFEYTRMWYLKWCVCTHTRAHVFIYTSTRTYTHIIQLHIIA